MTGYGQAVHCGDRQRLRVEARSLNHRTLEVHVRGASDLALEEEIKRMVGRCMMRGRVDVVIYMPSTLPPVDLQAAQSLVEQWKRLQKKLRLKGDVDVRWVLSYLASEGAANPRFDLVHRTAARLAAGEALRSLDRDRVREGKALKRDFRKRVDHLGKILKKLRNRHAMQPAREKRKLIERLKKLGQTIPLDSGRLEQEVVFFVGRQDVTEELVRLEEHVVALRNLLRAHGGIGRKMDFLLQEAHRELNTIGAKASDASLVRGVLDAKEEVERMREQTQNVE